jgi:FkbM family methyltransferase
MEETTRTAESAESERVADTVEMPEALERLRPSLGSVIQRAVGAVTVLVVLGVVLTPRMSVNKYDVAAAAVGLILVVAGWLALAPMFPRLRPVPTRSWDATGAVLCLLMTGVAAVSAYFGAYRTGWDASMIKYAVTQPPDLAVVNAYSAYPNLRPFVAIARAVYGWAAGAGLDYEGGFAVANTASFLVAAVAVYLTVRLVAGPAHGVLALLMLGGLVSTSPWLSVAYTDTAALWAPIGAVALLTAAFRWPRWASPPALMSAVGGVVLAAGYLVKTTPIVGVLALLGTLAVAATTRYGPRRPLLAIGICAVAVFPLAVPALGAWVKAAEQLPPLDENRGSRPLTYIAAGMRTQTLADGSTAYGGYDRDVARLTKGRDAATQDATARQLIQEEWDRRGLLGTAGFAVDKTLFNWGDGTFWARDEGADATAPPLRQGPLADAVLAWNAPSGNLFRLHVLLSQITWTAVLLALGVGLLRSSYRPEVLLMALTIAGIAAFTLLFQGRSRYLIGHVPVVVALAACVLPRPRLARPRLAKRNSAPRTPGRGRTVGPSHRGWLPRAQCRLRDVERQGGDMGGPAGPTVRRRLLRLLPAVGLRVIDIAAGSVVLSRSPRTRARPVLPGAVLVEVGSRGRGGRLDVSALSEDAALLTAGRLGWEQALAAERKVLHVLLPHILMAHLTRYEVNCVVDVGANRGQYARMLRQAGYTGRIVSFEPIPPEFALLEEAAADDPNWEVRPLALGSSEGTLEMHVTPGTLSSPLPPTSFGEESFYRLRHTTQAVVPVRRLDGMLDEILADLPDPRPFLKMDTQGFDVEVFLGLGARAREFVGLQSEVALLQLYQDMPRLPEALGIYEEAGFEVSGMYPVTRHQATGRVLEFDCVMVRADSLRSS